MENVLVEGEKPDEGGANQVLKLQIRVYSLAECNRNRTAQN